ncbi:unnamed protein product [Penicillium salamii]|uniref:Zn(2)-C6 fungal-type domain-containing protein n=1 Tax=Penicillium salamii TaxID=1612424 RepID=A0A9W4NRW5_9EURO|nr:unnamed protein product [Penicillium salamii]CAG8060671.1 unnamed protein product [Penicillium salamii]CAG8163322.1 unnamed protein product [Penicillium salamii]CAG8165225.1 unnamed protein product [Penicillium salamii]CAG8230841.1 unnamed protein product [Penicillium salamii]
MSDFSPSGLLVRQRSARACLNCRQRKRKCDGKHPCNTCVGYGYDCNYDAAQAASSNKKRQFEGEPAPTQAAKAARISSEPLGVRQNASSAPSGILDSAKSRYVGRYSCVAFPLCVGLELQAAKPPRLHSFAYHLGARKEPDSTVRLQLTKRISWNTIRSQLDFFFTTIHPVFGFLDKILLYERCEKHWHGQPQSPDFEAIVSGVAALTSLFSGSLDGDKEMWLALHAKEILEDPFVSRFPSIDQVAAWILRTLYLRATTRPHVAWICSCTLMHLVEATGLHQAPQSLILATRKGLEDSSSELSDALQRTAWVAHCLHVIIAYEYGRSVMNLEIPAQKSLPLSTGVDDFTPQLCSLVDAVPLSTKAPDTSVAIHELSSSLIHLAEISVGHDFLILVRADLGFSVYRRLRLLKSNLKESLLNEVITMGMSALPAARTLVSQIRPWWNVISTVFQFVCVLLVIDTQATVKHLPEAMDTLEMIVDVLDTHLAKEAITTARNLVRASLEKRRKGIETLERVLGPSSPAPAGNDNRPEEEPELVSPYSYPQQSSDFDFLLNMDFFN